MARKDVTCAEWWVVGWVAGGWWWVLGDGCLFVRVYPRVRTCLVRDSNTSPETTPAPPSKSRNASVAAGALRLQASGRRSEP